MTKEIASPHTNEILYEHELIRSSSPADRILRGFGMLFWIIYTLYLIYIFLVELKISSVELILTLSVALFYYVAIKYYKFGLLRLLLMSIFVVIFYMVISPNEPGKSMIFFSMSFGIMLPFIIIIPNSSFHLKIKLTITNTELLIVAPSCENKLSRDLSGFINLKLLIAWDIRQASIKDIRNPELKDILRSDTRFKVAINKKLRNSPYLYVFVLTEEGIYSAQFVDLELKDHRHILIEFDDATKFISVLAQLIPRKHQ